MAKAEKKLVSTTHDCFNGVIETYETKEGFYVVQTRKNITTDILTEEEATAKVEEFVNDTMF